jgi:hypothetical protein
MAPTLRIRNMPPKPANAIAVRVHANNSATPRSNESLLGAARAGTAKPTAATVVSASRLRIFNFMTNTSDPTPVDMPGKLPRECEGFIAPQQI